MNVWILSQLNSEVYENKRLQEELQKKNISVEIKHPNNFDIIVNKSTDNVLYNNESIELPDKILVRTGSSTNYFTSALLKHFEKLNVPIVNSSTGINNARDKLCTHQILFHHELSTPKTMLVKFPVSVEVVEAEIGFPCIIKVLQGSYGNGVHLCHSKEYFEKLIEFLKNLSIKKPLLIQEYVDACPGTDLRVVVINQKVIGAMKRIAPIGDFRANISHGGSGELYPINSEIEQLALRSAEVLDLKIAGVDLLFDKEGYKICEVNSAPGFNGFENFCNIDVASKIISYILETEQP